ncbi:hypothetical protein HMPREF9946_02136 [Acetobacteraceae bacterium AT-5844]|nr:hypothetical protein HMPREF9946_02136 [Acetobacteraceae bacterium AT-5844]
MTDQHLPSQFVYPTNYGVSVPVHPSPEPVDGEEGAFLFSLEATAVAAGIYEPERRAAFCAEASIAAQEGRSFLELLAKFGGAPVLRIPLPRPVRYAYESVPTSPGGASVPGASLRDVVDELITGVSDHHRWCDRASALLAFMEVQSRVGNSVPAPIRGRSMSILIAAVLENLGENEIDCLEAAAFYALSAHEEWSHAGRSWLMPVRKTWLADWIKDRPDYRKLAALVSHTDIHVPSWLQRPERAA